MAKIFGKMKLFSTSSSKDFGESSLKRPGGAHEEKCIRNTKQNVSKYEIKHVGFARYSANIDDTSNHRIIICGGSRIDESNTLEMKKNGSGLEDIDINLAEIGCRYGFNVISFITTKSNKLVVIQPFNGIYNVYDLETRKWLLHTNTNDNSNNSSGIQGIQGIKGFIHKLNIFNFQDIGQRYLFINDNLLIISFKRELHFYDLTNISKPKEIQKFAIKSVIPNQKNIGYINHGMCLISFRENTAIANKQKTYFISVLLFGGKGNAPFESTFIRLDITVVIQDTDTDTDRGRKMVINKILESKIHKMDLFHLSKNLLQLYHFSCHCVENKKNERIVLIIGGFCDNSYETGDSIFLYNVDKNIIVEKNKVALFFFVCENTKTTKKTFVQGYVQGYSLSLLFLFFLFFVLLFVFFVFFVLLFTDFAN